MTSEIIVVTLGDHRVGDFPLPAGVEVERDDPSSGRGEISEHQQLRPMAGLTDATDDRVLRVRLTDELNALADLRAPVTA